MSFSMMGPMGHAASVTGLPTGKPKGKTHRGRKPSGKPGASHLSQLQQAHGSGDFKAAKTHALNYAKAVHIAPSSTDVLMGGGGDQESADDAMAPVAASVAPPTPIARPKPTVSRAMLAKLAMSRGTVKK